MNIECFSCAGGMAEGFRRAGIEFDFAFDFAKDHCDSYQANLGHRPICMDVRDLLRLSKAGLIGGPVDLFVADPPCTPWSRAGKRKGTEDERDMLEDTCDLIRLLRPRAYLIGNVPGLDDSKNWHVVQRVIGNLQKCGYCVADFAALDAADYGVPQHRVRPFWFGHLDGPCIRWPLPTHCDPDTLRTLTLPGIEPMRPWVTCRQALAVLDETEMGRPVRLRKRNQNSKQHGSIRDRPARVVGTSNLSDGNVLLNEKHPPNELDAPSSTIGAVQRTNGSSCMRVTRHEDPDRNHEIDRPARTITSQSRYADNGSLFTGTAAPSGKHPALSPDEPSTTIRGGGNGHSAPPLVYVDDPKHPGSDIDEPAMAVTASDGGGGKRTIKTGTKRKRDEGRPGQGMRVGKADQVSKTITSKAARVGAGESHVLEWPWDRPSTVVQADPRIPPPGHHDEEWDGGLLSTEGAIVLSERAAAILQGFPASWVFSGKVKKTRWSQIGQAMPPGLAHAVASSVAEQRKRTAEQPEIPPSLATGKLTVV